MRRILLTLAVGLMVACSSGQALAQYDNRALYDRIDRLERDLQMLQSQAARGGGSTVITSPALGGAPVRSGSESPMPAGLATRLDDRVDQMEEMVRQLTGRVEEANFKAQQVAKQLERMQADIDLRLKDLQAAQTAAAPSASAGDAKSAAATDKTSSDKPAPPTGPQTLGALSDRDLKKAGAAPAKTANDADSAYDAAFASAQAGDYPAAERGFQDFLAKYPTHRQAGNAQYWLGDIAFTRKDYDTAAATFLDAYKKYPKHNKQPDMIYKAGSAFGLKGKKKEACTAFSILFSNHPDMPDRVKRAAVADKQKYDCK